jgi:hypothetical protein
MNDFDINELNKYNTSEAAILSNFPMVLVDSHSRPAASPHGGMYVC